MPDLSIIYTLFAILFIYFTIKRYIVSRRKVNLVFASWGIIIMVYFTLDVNVNISNILLLLSFIIGKIISKNRVWYFPIITNSISTISFFFQDIQHFLEIPLIKVLFILLWIISLMVVLIFEKS
jgi:hypothetical protein